MLRRASGALGRLLVAGGVLILLFVAYQLWGTGLKEAASQHTLKHQFETELARQHRSSSAHPSRSNGAANQAEEAQDEANAPPPPPEGQAVGILKIPAIDLEKVVVQGVGESDLQEGPGHYPETPLPGQAGNAAIAGHRTTYGAPFFRLNELVAGDAILVTTKQGAFRYVVQQSMVVDPDDSAVVGPTPGNHLTLTTCNPRYSAAQRLIVVAALAGRAYPASPPLRVAAPVRNGTPTVSTSSLDGPRTDWLPALWWGVGFAAAFGVTWWLGRRWGRASRRSRLLTWLACAPALGALLFFFFASVSVVLPAQY